MFVIEVIPLARTTPTGPLSYYSATDYPVGTCITVPVRNRELQSVVVSSQSVSAAKTALRAATFSLKKLTPQPQAARIPESVIKTATALTDELPASLGSILFTLLPPDVRTGKRPYPATTTSVENESTPLTLLSGTRSTRFIAYKSTIRQSFAHRGSVLFIVPTSAAVESARRELETGIEKRVITFASSHSKKRLQEAYEQFADLSTAKLIITTPHFAFLERHDLMSIIVDEAGSAHYKMKTRPYLDMRDAIKAYAKITKRALLYGDILLRTEEEALRREDSYATFDEPTQRINFDSTFTIATHPPYVANEKFSLMTEELRDAIGRTIQSKGHVFLFAARRGFAPLIYCFDCGHVFRCPDSGAPYSLFETGSGETKERWFVSPTSGRRVRAADVCPICGSWRLREQGIGIQQIAQYVRAHVKSVPIIIFDHTTATTAQKAQKLAEQFYESKSGAVMIGTAMALPYLTKPIELTAITSYEAARAIPTWRAEETLLRMLLSLREITTRECIVQIRTEIDPLLKYAARGMTEDFYAEEIEMRLALKYPPFAHFILLSWLGSNNAIRETEQLITSVLADTPIQCYNNPLPTQKGTVRHGLIRLDRRAWPDRELMDKLRQLPPSVRIEVAPEKII